jgi:hypothetical protein
MVNRGAFSSEVSLQAMPRAFLVARDRQAQGDRAEFSLATLPSRNAIR